MADMFDYLAWRGDLPFSQVPPGPADALIFSALSYISLDGIVPETPHEWVRLENAALEFLADPRSMEKVRVDQDLELLAAAATTTRFRNVGISFYQDVFIPEEDTQFSAVTFYLDDGSAFLTFRGTDNTLVGWKEDFNMTFLESIPAQRLARKYTADFAAASRAPLYLNGHSKGGNLAVYAAAKSEPAVQKRIQWIYTHDGPGFMEHILTDPGYLAIVPKIRTYVPQSSVFGMLLDREEPHTVIKSRHFGLMQHDPYSWEVMGPGFVVEEELSPDSRFLDRTFKTWLAGMTTAERNAFFDSVFELLMIEDTSRPRDILRPQNLRSYFQNLKSDEGIRNIIASELASLIRSAKAAQKQNDTQEEA